jgi:hypothetical protein
VKSKVGSPTGTSGELGTTVWPRSAKKRRKERLISALLITIDKHLAQKLWPRPLQQ